MAAKDPASGSLGLGPIAPSGPLIPLPPDGPITLADLMEAGMLEKNLFRQTQLTCKDLPLHRVTALLQGEQAAGRCRLLLDSSRVATDKEERQRVRKDTKVVNEQYR